MAAAGASGKTYSFKAVLLGEGCVGKTSLVLRYCENKFNDKHITTLQVRQVSWLAARLGCRPAVTASRSVIIGEISAETLGRCGSCLWGCHCWWTRDASPGAVPGERGHRGPEAAAA